MKCRSKKLRNSPNGKEQKPIDAEFIQYQHVGTNIQNEHTQETRYNVIIRQAKRPKRTYKEKGWMRRTLMLGISGCSHASDCLPLMGRTRKVLIEHIGNSQHKRTEKGFMYTPTFQYHDHDQDP